MRSKKKERIPRATRSEQSKVEICQWQSTKHTYIVGEKKLRIAARVKERTRGLEENTVAREG